jgi:hypothetical protein
MEKKIWNARVPFSMCTYLQHPAQDSKEGEDE